MKEHGIFVYGARASIRANTVLKFKIQSRVFNQANMECVFPVLNGRTNGFEHLPQLMNLFPGCRPEGAFLARVKAAHGFQYFTHFIMQLALEKVRTPCQCGSTVRINQCSRSIL
jgi:hypothetical protein